MKDAELAAQVEAANAYERLFVPALFGEWAPRMAAAAGVATSSRVLDVACGTGVLAREAALLTKGSGRVAGVDPNRGMLTVAERLNPAIEWRQGTAEALPFEDRSFDVVMSQFGMMFFADRGIATREMARVLVAGGRCAVAVWDALERSPGYAAEVALLHRLAGEEAANALRAPFVLADPAVAGRLFKEAGFDAVDIMTQQGTADFPSVRAMVEADLRGWLPVMGVHLSEADIGRILSEAEQALRPFVTPDGRVRFAAPAHLVSGTKPKT